eukprot:315089_1
MYPIQRKYINDNSIENSDYVETIMSLALNSKNRCHNLLKSTIFKLFPNLEEIVMCASHGPLVKIAYPFNTMSLLSVLNDTLLPPSFKKIIVKDGYGIHFLRYFEGHTPQIVLEIGKKEDRLVIFV